jgi:ferredoxin, 2Fe-2S
VTSAETAPGTDTVHAVHVEPGGFDLAVREGEPLMRAALRTGYRWPNVCGGEAMCGICQIRVVDGAENASLMGRTEQTRLKFVGRGGDPGARLACQLTVTGPMTVFKRGVRPDSR